MTHYEQSLPHAARDPLVSVCIASYNHEAYIGEAIESTLAQTYPNVEIVVVDDASQDGTAAIVRDFAARFPNRVRTVLMERNIGAPAAQNRAFHEARGEFAAILGSDDRMRPVRLARQIAFLQANPDFVGVFSDIDVIDAKGAPSPHRAHIEEIFNRPVGNLRRQLLSGNFLNAPSATLRRADFLAAGGYNVALRYLHDFDLWGRLLLRGELGKLPERLTEYRIHDTNLSVFDEAGMPFPVRCEIVATIVEFVRSWPHERILEEALESDLDRAQALLRLAALLQQVDLHYLHKPQLGCAYAYQLILEASRLAPDTDPSIKRDLERLLKDGFDPEQTAGAGLKALPAQTETVRLLEGTLSPKSYLNWLAQRKKMETKRALLENYRISWSSQPVIQIIIRAEHARFPLLTRTLESLNTQNYERWQIDIFSTSPSPSPELYGMAQVRWNMVNRTGEIKGAIDKLVSTCSCDWLLELPAGAALDQMCLYRFAEEAARQLEETTPKAWFVDDDYLDSQGLRHHPRLKPALDSLWIQCTDLLGPILVSTSAWQTVGGATFEATRPWYDLALRLIDQFGETAFGHIAEPLLSLPDTLAHDRHSSCCMAAVKRSLARRSILGKLAKKTDEVWRTEHPLRASPAVTIAIPSLDKPEYLAECVNLILTQTIYPDYDILIVDGGSTGAETIDLLRQLELRKEAPVRIVSIDQDLDFASFANKAANSSTSDYVLFLADDIRITKPNWLNIFITQSALANASVAGPLLVSPQESRIAHSGLIPGLCGIAGSMHLNEQLEKNNGYLNALVCSREVGAVAGDCMLVLRSDALEAGLMADSLPCGDLADIDFCFRLRAAQKKVAYIGDVGLVQLGGSCLRKPICSASESLALELDKARTEEYLVSQWGNVLISDEFWNRNLDLGHASPQLKKYPDPSWYFTHNNSSRILAFPVSSIQGDIRVSEPLETARLAGLVESCILLKKESTETRTFPASHDLARTKPDAIVLHQIMGPSGVALLRQLRMYLPDVFLVYEMDDLFTQMPLKNSLRAHVPADARSFLAKSLSLCDRLVVSTQFLADRFATYCKDVRVVPNRLVFKSWAGLKSLRMTSEKPRVGWAGGTTHLGDLELIESVVRSTCEEVDWIFMGMCPDALRPYVSEFHPFGDYERYPARLASLNLDLAVAPLQQIPFNQGKSNLRLLEYGILGIPVVCTDIDPYQHSPACTVPNTLNAWLTALRDRIHDPDARIREGDAMRQWVLDHFILEDHLEEWVNAHLPNPISKGRLNEDRH